MILAVWCAFYMIASIGFAYVVGHSAISKTPREWLYRFAILRPLVDLIECPACVGFWIGLAASIAGVTTFTVASNNLLNILGWAFFTSGSNFLLGKATKLME